MITTTTTVPTAFLPPLDMPRVLLLHATSDQPIVDFLRRQIAADALPIDWIETPTNSRMQQPLLHAQLRLANRLVLVVTRRFLAEFARHESLLAKVFTRMRANTLKVAVVLAEPLSLAPSQLSERAKRLPSNRWQGNPEERLRRIAREVRLDLGLVRPVRDVLCVYACPQGSHGPALDPLRLDLEHRNINEANRLHGGRLRFHACFAARARDLHERLHETPDVIHIAGHGEDGGIWLEDDRGEPRQLGIVPLLRVLERYRPRCLVLNACHSAAAVLGNHTIPHVIAMQGTSSDIGSITFSSSFYAGLARKLDVETAFDRACEALTLEQIGDCRPVLMRGVQR